MIVDTSALLAFFDSNEPDHPAVSEAILADQDGLVVSPYVVAELDYLLMTRHGAAAEIAVLKELTGGSWELASFDADRLRVATGLVTKYRDLRIGVADASNIVLAQAYRTTRIATLDRRHFSVLRLIGGGVPDIVP